jgi:hypothetical protein
MSVVILIHSLPKAVLANEASDDIVEVLAKHISGFVPATEGL